MRFLVLAICLLFPVSAAWAADEPLFSDPSAPRLTAKAASNTIFSELRLGTFGHNFTSTFESGSVDVNGELLFAKPLTSTDPWIDALLPRPHLGATINTGDKTSHAYAGLTWTVPLGERFFVEGSFGASINNGLDGPARRNPHLVQDRAPIGCNLLFRESASIGFNITQSWSVMGTFEHTSNAGLCDSNSGLSNAGVRFGYKF
jgi:lipid A 3-O-deacylase